MANIESIKLPDNTEFNLKDAISGYSTTFNGLSDTNFTSLQNGQVPVYNSSTHLWENASAAGGLKPHVVISTTHGSTVTVTKGGTTITPTETSSGIYEADLTDYGTWTATATFGGATSTATISVDTVKVYNVALAYFTATITATYPAGATCTLSATGQSTQTADTNPYTFTVHAAATYTVTATDGGDSTSDTVTITTDGQSESVTLSFVPDGSTVTPTDDIQTWLACGGVSGKSYTTLAEVLNESGQTTLLALIQSDNACDYLARSTTWASSACADSGFMTKVGANNYASDTLLAVSAWLSAIWSSSYKTNVLNAKVPTMTNYTTPSGTVSAQDENGSNYAWRAFDGVAEQANGWCATSLTSWIQYQFTSPVCVKRIEWSQLNGSRLWVGELQYSDDGTTFTTVQSNIQSLAEGNHSLDIPTSTHKGGYWRLTCVMTTPGTYPPMISELQFYGRKDV